MNNNILVAVVNYNEKDFVHPRNLEYIANGYKVTVVDFVRNEDCYVDGIRTITLRTYVHEKQDYSILILHAANIKNHYRFLKKYGDRFKHFIFFYHGHEVLMCNKVYSKPYYYVGIHNLSSIFRDLYDYFKLRVWKYYLPKITYKSEYVFVSEWMQNEFYKWTKIESRLIEDKTHIIYNCIGEEFEKAKYDFTAEKQYDFVTIRANIDGSKYCVDLVNKWAKNNPEFKFLLIGCGDYFEYDKKADNIRHIQRKLAKSEIIVYLQQSRCALMPTRTDAQGVMMCEMASIGMPLITTDIPVCHEVFDDFENIGFIKLDSDGNELHHMLNDLEKKEPYVVNEKYYHNNTCFVEVKLLNKMMSFEDLRCLK